MYIKHALSEEHRLIRVAAVEKNKKDFLAAGGCGSCWGWGGDHYRDTMDSVGYDYVWFPCKRCDGKRNPCPGSAYRNSNGFMQQMAISFSKEDIERMMLIEAAISRIETIENSILNEKQVRKYKEVIVKKGRTAPIGFQGIVFWVGYNSFGEKIGIRNANNEVAWSYSKNVEVLI